MSKSLEEKELELQRKVEEGIAKAVGDLSDVQVRDGLRNVMMIGIASNEIPPEIAEQIKIWDELGKSNFGLMNLPGAISRTMDAFYEYFKSKGIDLDSLKSKAPFALNMYSHLSNSTVVCYEMGLFCKYIALVSQKSPDHQKVLLDSFPPKTSADITCIGGTGSRIGDLIQQIQGSKEDQYFVESHKTLMSQLLDKIKDQIPESLHVHTSPFLDYALSLETPEVVAKRDPCFSFPYNKMNVSVLWELFTGHGQKTRDLVGKKLGESEDFKREVLSYTSELLTELGEVDLDAALTDFSDRGKNARKEIEFITGRILNKTGDESQNDQFAMSIAELVELDEESELERYVLSPTKIAAGITTKMFVNFKVKDKESAPSQNQSLLDEISSASAIFKSETVDNLSKLIQSDDRRDVEAAVELLWIMGANMEGGSPLQFIRTINAIKAEDKIKYLKETVQGKISSFYEDKLTKIVYDYNKHSKNVAITSRLNGDVATNAGANELGVLLSIGATTEKIKSYAEKNRDTHLLGGDADWFKTDSWAHLLTKRVDCVEILKKLRESNIELGKSLQKELFKWSVFANKPELCRYALDNFGIDKDVFKDERILIKVMSMKDATLVDDILKKCGVEYLGMKRPFVRLNGEPYRGLALLHSAVILGEEDAVKKMIEKGVDPNLRTGANIFHPKSLVPANPLHPRGLYQALMRPLDIPLDIMLSYTSTALRYVFSETSMHLAASAGRSSMIDILAEKGGDIDALAYGKNFSLCFRPLHCAIAGGYKTAAEKLIEKGASLESKTAVEPPLTRVAVVNNQPHCFELLMEKGVKITPYELDSYAFIPFLKLPSNKPENEEMLNVLIRNGAYVPSLDNGNSTIRSARCFQAVSKAIMQVATESIVNPTPESRDRLTELEREIYKTLIKTYDLKADDLITDFGLRSFDLRGDISRNKKIRDIGKNIVGRMGVEAANDSGNFSLKRIFSYSSDPRQDVDISRDKEFVKDSLSSREAISNISEVQEVVSEVGVKPARTIRNLFAGSSKIKPTQVAPTSSPHN
ncbi:MAG: ankyrin repeat domain-containing protein [Alphaproteobacteria bacterium]|nr:ankyrin repeat domain-containing protein [Alphaproteobacteria bacterium]